MQTEEMELVKFELDKYLKEAAKDKVPILTFYNRGRPKSSTYRILSHMARDI